MTNRKTVLVVALAMALTLGMASGVSPAYAHSTSSRLKTLESRVKTLGSQMASVYGRLLRLESRAGVPGSQGPAGNNGYNGSMGPKGETGPEGDRGLQGPVGSQGAAGVVGPVGPSGSQGEVGPSGVDGNEVAANFWPNLTIEVGPNLQHWGDLDNSIALRVPVKVMIDGLEVPGAHVFGVLHLGGADYKLMQAGTAIDDDLNFGWLPRYTDFTGAQVEYWVEWGGKLEHETVPVTYVP